MAAFNIDKMKSNFEPVEIVFRGKTYMLGRDALGLLEACELCGTIEDKDGMEYFKAQLGMLPQLMKCLCPRLEIGEDLETGEQMALIEVTMEVLGRVGRLSFQKAEQEGDDS